jgi:NifB/MoaA-like Fe-S oxidoreductase
MTLVCGTLIAPLLTQVGQEMQALTRLRLRVVPVTNRYFGSTVGASGLLTGRDVLLALRGQEAGDVVALPRFMLDAAGKRFLDDLSPADIEAELGVPVVAAETPNELVRILEKGIPASYGATQETITPPPWRLGGFVPTSYYRVRRPRWEHPVALSAKGL